VAVVVPDLVDVPVIVPVDVAVDEAVQEEVELLDAVDVKVATEDTVERLDKIDVKEAREEIVPLDDAAADIDAIDENVPLTEAVEVNEGKEETVPLEEAKDVEDEDALDTELLLGTEVGIIALGDGVTLAVTDDEVVALLDPELEEEKVGNVVTESLGDEVGDTNVVKDAKPEEE